jgi:hypothetical protein
MMPDLMHLLQSVHPLVYIVLALLFLGWLFYVVVEGD